MKPIVKQMLDARKAKTSEVQAGGPGSGRRAGGSKGRDSIHGKDHEGKWATGVDRDKPTKENLHWAKSEMEMADEKARGAFARISDPESANHYEKMRAQQKEARQRYFDMEDKMKTKRSRRKK